MGLPKLGSCRLALSAAKPNNHPVRPLASAAASSALSKLLGFSRNKSGINPTYRSRALLQVGAERSEAQPNNHPVHPLASAAASSALSKLLGFSRNKSGINPTCRSRALLQVGAERSEAQQPSGPSAPHWNQPFAPDVYDAE